MLYLALLAVNLLTDPEAVARAAMAMQSSSPQPSAAKAQPKRGTCRVLVSPNCPPCHEALTALEKAKDLPFDLTVETVTDQETPQFLMNNPKSGKTHVIGWYGLPALLKRYEIGPSAPKGPKGSYPLRNSNWSGPVATKADAINHLLNHPNHRGQFKLSFLQSLSLSELQALHSDDHEINKPFSWAE